MAARKKMARKKTKARQKKTSAPKTHLLIDGDVLVYRYAAGEETPIVLTNGIHTLYADPTPARAKIDDFVSWLVDLVRADRYTMVLSDPEASFRRAIYPGYKGNRQKSRRPLLYWTLRAYAEEKHGAVWCAGLEGDDLLGLWSTDERVRGERRIIASVDKDMRCIPGLLIDWDNPENGVEELSVEEADRFFLTQVLSGDPTDGYPGCPKIGAVRAKRALEDVAPADAWDSVIVPAYEKAGLTEEWALTQARCAWILRHGDYDDETGEVTLWTPQQIQ